MTLRLSSNRSLALAILAFAAALIFVFCCITPANAYASRTYGVLCSKYESGNDPACIDPACAYGAYQMSKENAYIYAKWLKEGAGKKEGSDDYKACSNWGKYMVDAYVKDGKTTGTKFDKKWKAFSAKYPTLSFNTQYTYVKTHYYDEAVLYWKKVAPGFNPDNFSKGLRCALFSTAVQHGPYGSAYYIFKNALKTLGGWSKKLTEDQLIDAVYKERSRKSKGTLVHFYSSSAEVQAAIYNRLHNNERRDAFDVMLASGGKCGHKVTKGGSLTYLSSKATDTTHSATVSQMTCVCCGKVVKKKHTETCTHSFKYAGTAYKCACGAAFVVHKNAWYSCSTDVKLRAKAKKSATALVLAKKGSMLQVTASKVGSDKCWWGKVTLDGKTGYVPMSHLSVHGSASGKHNIVDGACTYCKATEAQLAVCKKGTYKLTANTYYYTAAYSGSDKVSAIKKGKKVTIAKVVHNCHHNYWGVTKKGKYVDMSLLTK